VCLHGYRSCALRWVARDSPRFHGNIWETRNVSFETPMNKGHTGTDIRLLGFHLAGRSVCYQRISERFVAAILAIVGYRLSCNIFGRR